MFNELQLRIYVFRLPPDKAWLRENMHWLIRKRIQQQLTLK